MLEGLLAILTRTFARTEVTVMTADPAGTHHAFGVRTVRMPKPAPGFVEELRLLPVVGRAQLVTLGGGDLVRETARGLPPARVWGRRLRFAHMLRRPTAALGISIGELWSTALEAETTSWLRRMRLLAVRDSDSAERLRRLGLDAMVMGDLALEAPGTDPETVAGLRPSSDGADRPPRIALVVREPGDRGGHLAEGAGDRMRAALVAALDDLVEARGASIELIPFRTRPHPNLPDDDEQAGRTLAAAARTGSAWRSHPRPATAADFVRLATGMDAVVAVRLHGLVLGAAAGSGLVGLEYDTKIRGFLTELGIPSQSLPFESSPAVMRAAIGRAIDDTSLRIAAADGLAAARRRTASVLPQLRALVAGAAT